MMTARKAMNRASAEARTIRAARSGVSSTLMGDAGAAKRSTLGGSARGRAAGSRCSGSRAGLVGHRSSAAGGWSDASGR